MSQRLQTPEHDVDARADGEASPDDGLTLALARRASSLRIDSLPSDVIELARQALLDWFGVTLSGSQETAISILLDALPKARRDDPGAVTIVGHDARLPPLDAALVNGTASHVLDFDDVNATFLGHASVAIAGAALALGEQLDVSGGNLIGAFVAGYEVACRIAAAIGPEPYLRGFHSTGTVGTFGAAAACANLLELDAPRTATAFGLAASQAAGIKCNIGTMTKSFHAGRACQNGLLAALLAARGFTAAADSIETEQGFAAVSGGTYDADASLADPAFGWYLRHNLFKYHASCYWTHSTIEGIRELVAVHQLAPADVDRITLHISELERGTCTIPEPGNGLEVKFSLAHLAAMTLLGRDTAVITEADARDPEVVAVRGRIVLVDDGRSGHPTRVELTTSAGSTHEAAVDVNLPADDLPAQHARLAHKFQRLADPVIGSGAAGELGALVGSLDESASVRPMMESTRASHGDRMQPPRGGTE